MATANNNLTLGGDYINNGTKRDFGTTSKITINGAGSQNIAGLGKSGTLINTISVTKASGTATFTGDVYATQVTINGSGGTPNLGSGTTVSVTNLTLTTGALNGGSSTLYISGTWAGTTGFTPNTGTVNYNGGAAQTVAAVSFNNLILSGSGTKSIASSSTSVGGSLSVSSGVTVALSTGINVKVKSLALNG